jgi:copper chaperone CopZ
MFWGSLVNDGALNTDLAVGPARGQCNTVCVTGTICGQPAADSVLPWCDVHRTELRAAISAYKVLDRVQPKVLEAVMTCRETAAAVKALLETVTGEVTTTVTPAQVRAELIQPFEQAAAEREVVQATFFRFVSDAGHEHRIRRLRDAAAKGVKLAAVVVPLVAPVEPEVVTKSVVSTCAAAPKPPPKHRKRDRHVHKLLSPDGARILFTHDSLRLVARQATALGLSLYSVVVSVQAALNAGFLILHRVPNNDVCSAMYRVGTGDFVVLDVTMNVLQRFVAADDARSYMAFDANMGAMRSMSIDNILSAVCVGEFPDLYVVKTWSTAWLGEDHVLPVFMKDVTGTASVCLPFSPCDTWTFLDAGGMQFFPNAGAVVTMVQGPALPMMYRRAPPPADLFTAPSNTTFFRGADIELGALQRDTSGGPRVLVTTAPVTVLSPKLTDALNAVASKSSFVKCKRTAVVMSPVDMVRRSVFYQKAGDE